MREAEFGLVAFSGNFKDDICACPLGFIINKAEVVGQDMPYDLFAGDEFCDLERAVVQVLIVVIKHGAGLISVTFDCL